jgi:hypothetical protein
MKLSRIPRLHIRSDFRQLRHRPKASSHLRCLSRQVKHPVRTRLALVSAISEDLRFALDWRGELLFCFGVAGFGFALGGACDCDFAWDRVVRFISFFVVGCPPSFLSSRRRRLERSASELIEGFGIRRISLSGFLEWPCSYPACDVSGSNTESYTPRASEEAEGKVQKFATGGRIGSVFGGQGAQADEGQAGRLVGIWWLAGLVCKILNCF